MLGCLFLLSDGAVKQRSYCNRTCPVHRATKVCEVKVAQSCPTLCKPMDSTVQGILQARILEWVAFPFSEGSSLLRDRTQVSCVSCIGRRIFYQLSYLGIPTHSYCYESNTLYTRGDLSKYSHFISESPLKQPNEISHLCLETQKATAGSI